MSGDFDVADENIMRVCVVLRSALANLLTANPQRETFPASF
jgi:hypothetical protein